MLAMMHHGVSAVVWDVAICSIKRPLLIGGNMVYLRVVGAIALLGLLAACDDSQAPTGGPTPLMDVGPTPVVLKQGEVLRDADGNIIAQAFTTAEAIEYLEKRAAEDPEFLDTPLGSRSDDDTTTRLTFREILNDLRRQSQPPAAQQNRSTALDILSEPPSPPEIYGAETGAENGIVGSNLAVTATMSVRPYYAPLGGYAAKQEMDVIGISPGTIEFNFEKPDSDNFPWRVKAYVQPLHAGTYDVYTVHSVSAKTGNAWRQTSASGNVSEPPS